MIWLCAILFWTLLHRTNRKKVHLAFFPYCVYGSMYVTGFETNVYHPYSYDNPNRYTWLIFMKKGVLWLDFDTWPLNSDVLSLGVSDSSFPCSIYWNMYFKGNKKNLIICSHLHHQWMHGSTSKFSVTFQNSLKSVYMGSI